MKRADLVRINREVIQSRHVPIAGLAALCIEMGLHQQTQECFWVIAGDEQGNLHQVTEINRGTGFNVDVHLPAMLTAVVASGSTAFSVAHNHPTQSAAPSVGDMELTHAVMAAANACGLLFEDHVIVEPNGSSFSFRAAGLIIPTTIGGPKMKPLKVSRAAAARGKR